MTFPEFLLLVAVVVAVSLAWACAGDRDDIDAEHTVWADTEEVQP